MGCHLFTCAVGCLSWYPSNWASYFTATMMCYLCLYVVSTKTSSIKQCFYKNVQCNLMTPGLGTPSKAFGRLISGNIHHLWPIPLLNFYFFLFFYFGSIFTKVWEGNLDTMVYFPCNIVTNYTAQNLKDHFLISVSLGEKDWIDLSWLTSHIGWVVKGLIYHHGWNDTESYNKV